jgi:NAD+ synthase
LDGAQFFVGLSGGVDSAVVAALATQIDGPARVRGLILPHRDSNPTDEQHARSVASFFNIQTERIDISDTVDAVARACPHGLSGLALANTKARARMVFLYAHANAEGGMVLGTGNKTELLTGYFTKFGDGAADVYPIGDVYKTDVWALARYLGVPAEVVNKPPTAGLWAGQTDEEDLGIRYHDLDRLLQAFEAGQGPEQAAERTGLTASEAQRIYDRIRQTEHKRSSLVIPKVGLRTPGLDWRLPRSTQ